MDDFVDLTALEERADSLVEETTRLMEQLVALRDHHHLSQAEVGCRMGVSQATVSGFEHYDANPTLSTVRRYALAVGARLEIKVTDDCDAHRAADDPESIWRVIGVPQASRPQWTSRRAIRQREFTEVTELADA